jgi:hypothetical protein
LFLHQLLFHRLLYRFDRCFLGFHCQSLLVFKPKALFTAIDAPNPLQPSISQHARNTDLTTSRSSVETQSPANPVELLSTKLNFSTCRCGAAAVGGAGSKPPKPKRNHPPDPPKARCSTVPRIPGAALSPRKGDLGCFWSSPLRTKRKKGRAVTRRPFFTFPSCRTAAAHSTCRTLVRAHLALGGLSVPGYFFFFFLAAFLVAIVGYLSFRLAAERS